MDLDSRKRMLISVICVDLQDSDELLNEAEAIATTSCYYFTRNRRLEETDNLYISTKKRRCESKLNVTRSSNFVEKRVPLYTEWEFSSHFRMSRSTLQVINNHLGKYLNSRQHKQGIHVVPLYTKTLASVWFLSTPESYRSVADRFELSTGTLHYIVHEFCSSFVSMKEKFITWPSDEAAQLIMQFFEKKFGFPGVVGCIDVCHIEIKPPLDNREDYYNHKDRTSIILQGACDHEMKLIDVSVGWPGSVPDADVWRTSTLKSALDRELIRIPEDGHLVADSAFPLEVNLLTPFIDNGRLTAKELRYNTKLGICRASIERTFALLKGRWQRLKYLDMTVMSAMSDVIITCCVMHNIIVSREGCDYTDESEESCAFETIQPCTEAVSKRNLIVNAL